MALLAVDVNDAVAIILRELDKIFDGELVAFMNEAWVRMWIKKARHTWTSNTEDIADLVEARFNGAMNVQRIMKTYHEHDAAYVRIAMRHETSRLCMVKPGVPYPTYRITKQAGMNNFQLV